MPFALLGFIAANLCHQALKIDPENSHAFYQLACAYTVMEQFDEALHFLAEALQALINDETFKELTSMMSKSSEH